MATAKGKRTSSAKSTTARASAKKGTSRGRKTSSQRERIFSSSTVGLFLLAVGILLVFCLWMPTNAPAIVGMRMFLNGTFGRLGWIYTLLLCYTGLQIAFGERWPLRRAALIPMALLAFCFSTLLQVFRMEDLLRALSSQGYRQNYEGFLWQSYEIAKSVPVGGGFIGGLLGYPMGRYLEVVGSALLLFFTIGGLVLLLVRMFVPSAGERVSGWFSQLSADWGERRSERAARMEERDPGLLVQIPKELRKQERTQEKSVKASIGKRKLPAEEPPAPVIREPAPPVRQAPPVQMPEPQPQPAPVQQNRAAQFPRQPALAGNGGPQPTLYIEDILPDDYSPPHDAYTEHDRNHGNGRDRQSRGNEGALPVFIAEGRDAYERLYGSLGRDESRRVEEEPKPRYTDIPAYDEESAQAQYDGFGADNEADDPVGAYAADIGVEQGPYDARRGNDETMLPADEPLIAEDAPWETVAPTYVAEPTEIVRTRRHRPQRQNPLDAQPQPAPETRLDRQEWKRPEPQPTGARVVQMPAPETEEYRQPPFSLLERDDGHGRIDTREEDEVGAQKLEETLHSFGVEARVIRVVHGPAITRYELQPAPGVKVSKIVSLTDDIALNMAAVGVRIEAPIPGKAAIGIEIANAEIATVRLRDVLESDESLRHPSRLAVALGKDVAGKRIIADLARMPHLLIAGATGSGKSVCINTLITSIIYRAKPEEVRLILIDPKKVELSVYNDIPHLLVPVVTDPKKANGALSWAVMEMDERYKLFAEIGVRDIRGYNLRRKPETSLMPQIVVIIDELSDLMLVAPGEVEESICRLAQLARACGIHLVIATQRPSVNVITGIIKANIPSRIAFAVSSHIDSRTILDSAGAEKLLGKGDMLYAPSGGGKPLRVQGCFVADDEVARVTDYVKERHKTDYSQDVIDALTVEEEPEAAPEEEQNDVGSDALFEQAVEMAIESGQTSISMLQRRLRVGYARAGRLIDDMARMNIISQADGAKPREVLITREDFQMMFKD